MWTTCPTCAEKIEVGTLKELRAHIKKCGKLVTGSKPVRHSLLPVATELPQLPFKILLGHKLESQNAAHKKHWTTHQKSVKAWRTVLEPRLAPLMGLDLSWSRWKFLRLIPEPHGRVYDYANLVGGGKAMVDVLVHFKVIHDDAPKYFEAEYEQVVQSELYASRCIYTIITLLEAKR